MPPHWDGWLHLQSNTGDPLSQFVYGKNSRLWSPAAGVDWCEPGSCDMPESKVHGYSGPPENWFRTFLEKLKYPKSVRLKWLGYRA